MCHFHLVSFVAVTELFWLISSVSQIRAFTRRIIGIAPTDSRAGKGTVQSPMEHQCRQWALLFLQNRSGREIRISIPTNPDLHQQMEELAHTADENYHCYNLDTWTRNGKKSL